MGETMVKDLGNGLFFIAKKETHEHIHCNAYLIIEENTGILVEPGNILDYDVVFDEVKKLIDLKNIKYVLLSHPDADLTSSMTLFDQELGDYQIITEWRTKEILAFYGLDSSYYPIREHNFRLKVSKDRTLYFYMTPFAHYAGSFITYDSKSKALLSGDLFGGYSKNWSPYADSEYVESMAMYHENYMPSSDFIRPVMKELSKMDISMICPQHGSIIPKELVKESINFLYNLDFYNSSNTVERVVKTNRKYDYENILTQMLIRLLNLYSKEDIKDVFAYSKIDVSFSPAQVSSTMKGYKLWNQFFDLIHKKKGDDWLNSLETLVNKITSIYQIKKPESYRHRYKHILDQKMQIDFEKNVLKLERDTLKKDYEQSIKNQETCPITGLPNRSAFRKFLEKNGQKDDGLLFIELDQIEEINRSYDKEVGDNQIKTLAYLVENDLLEDEQLFRSSGSGLIFYKAKTSEDVLQERANQIRNKIAESTSFIEHVTVGTGLIYLEETPENMDQVKEILSQGTLRVSVAHQTGKSEIISRESTNKDLYDFTVLLVDEDEININMITKYFARENIQLLHAKNPLEALKTVEEKTVHAIISEINLSKLDGFSLKQKLNLKNEYANIPFLFISHQKTHELIDRANQLEVNYFLQKPFFMNELLGLIKRMIKR